MIEAALGRWAQHHQLRAYSAVHIGGCWVILPVLASQTFFRQQRLSGLRDETNEELRRELHKLYSSVWEAMRGILGRV